MATEVENAQSDLKAEDLATFMTNLMGSTQYVDVLSSTNPRVLSDGNKDNSILAKSV